MPTLRGGGGGGGGVERCEKQTRGGGVAGVRGQLALSESTESLAGRGQAD